MSREDRNREAPWSSFAGQNDYLYTKGDQYTTDEGHEYIGEYHIRNNGYAYTGATIKSQPKSESKRLLPFYDDVDPFTYDKLNKFESPQKDHIDPIQYEYRIDPADNAYSNGFDVRYFVQRRGPGSYAIEIDLTQFERIGSQYGIDPDVYESATIIWQLVGTARLIEETNKARVNRASVTIPGLPLVIRNYTQFAKLTPQTITSNEDVYNARKKFSNNATPIKKTYDRKTGRIIKPG